MKQFIKSKKKTNLAKSCIEKPTRDFADLMEEIKPFLRKKSYPVYRTTKEWEGKNPDIYS